MAKKIATVETTAVHCRSWSCARTALAEIRVREVSRVSGPFSWLAKGSAQTAHCVRCGAVSRAVIDQVPVDLEGLPCPQCRKNVRYRVTIDCILPEYSESDTQNYSFVASVTCPGCAHQSIFRKVISSFRRVKRFKVSPTGVEVELTDGSSISTLTDS